MAKDRKVRSVQPANEKRPEGFLVEARILGPDGTLREGEMMECAYCHHGFLLMEVPIYVDHAFYHDVCFKAHMEAKVT